MAAQIKKPKHRPEKIMASFQSLDQLFGQAGRLEINKRIEICFKVFDGGKGVGGRKREKNTMGCSKNVSELW